MNIQEMLTAINNKTKIEVNDEQKAVIAHEDGPTMGYCRSWFRKVGSVGIEDFEISVY